MYRASRTSTRCFSYAAAGACAAAVRRPRRPLSAAPVSTPRRDDGIVASSRRTPLDAAPVSRPRAAGARSTAFSVASSRSRRCCGRFDQPLDSWDVSSGTDFYAMFYVPRSATARPPPPPAPHRPLAQFFEARAAPAPPPLVRRRRRSRASADRSWAAVAALDAPPTTCRGRQEILLDVWRTTAAARASRRRASGAPHRPSAPRPSVATPHRTRSSRCVASPLAAVRAADRFDQALDSRDVSSGATLALCADILVASPDQLEAQLRRLPAPHRPSAPRRRRSPRRVAPNRSSISRASVAAECGRRDQR